MRGYKIGDIIRQKREELGITQEDLCFGILDVSSLSRIENNRQYPSARSLVAIVERLDLPMERFMVMFTEKDFEIQEMCSEIVESNVVANSEKVLQLIDELEKINPVMEPVMQQFVLRCKTLATKRLLKMEEFIEQMTQAVKITVPNYDEDNIEKLLLSDEEAKCITNIANAYARNSERRRAIKMFESILKVLNKSYMLSDERAKAIPAISYSLAKCLNAEKEHLKAIAVCDTAISVCIKKRRFDMLPDLYMSKGCANGWLGNIPEATKLFEKAYIMFICFEKYALAQKMLVGIKDDYGIDLTNLRENHHNQKVL